MNTANKLTMLRVALIPVFLILLYLRFPFHMYFALTVFILASVTDFVDGYIARHYNQVTDFGKFMDPLADKVLVMAALLLFTVVQPYLPGQRDPNLIYDNPLNGLPLRNQQPNGEFWFGTNSIGQDLWARIWAGTRTSLFIGFVVAGVEALLGILAGMLWGYVRRVEFLFTELYNILDNLPQTLVLVLFSLILKPSIQTMVLAMCMTGWIQMARFVRNQIVILRDRDYNLASRCLGTSTWRILFKNLLPYLVSVIMLRVALAIPAAIGNEVFITYIGLGLPLEIPSLGNLLNEGRLLMTAPPLRYQLIFPTVVLAVITISFYIIGNAFADAADPKNHV